MREVWSGKGSDGDARGSGLGRVSNGRMLGMNEFLHWVRIRQVSEQRALGQHRVRTQLARSVIGGVGQWAEWLSGSEQCGSERTAEENSIDPCMLGLIATNIHRLVFQSASRADRHRHPATDWLSGGGRLLERLRGTIGLRR